MTSKKMSIGAVQLAEKSSEQDNQEEGKISENKVI